MSPDTKYNDSCVCGDTRVQRRISRDAHARSTGSVYPVRIFQPRPGRLGRWMRGGTHEESILLVTELHEDSDLVILVSCSVTIIGTGKRSTWYLHKHEILRLLCDIVLKSSAFPDTSLGSEAGPATELCCIHANSKPYTAGSRIARSEWWWLRVSLRLGWKRRGVILRWVFG